MLTVMEVARRLNLSPDRVRSLERSGQLRAAVKTATGMRLFDPEEVERVAREREEKRRR